MREHPAGTAILEHEARDDGAVTRPGKPGDAACDCRGIDEPEAGNRIAGGRVAHRRGLSVGSYRIGRCGAVENVVEFNPHIEADTLRDAELAREAHVFRWPALETVVVIERRSAAESACRRIRPCRRIQNESGARIVAVAVNVFHRVERYAGNTV